MNKLIFLLVLFSAPSFADEWTKTNSILEGSWQAVNLIDWGQTLDIADKCRFSSIHERNPLLPRCPTFKEVNRHFLIGAVLHFSVSKALPKTYREVFQITSITYGVSIIDSNFKLGLEMKF